MMNNSKMNPTATATATKSFSRRTSPTSSRCSPVGNFNSSNPFDSDFFRKHAPLAAQQWENGSKTHTTTSGIQTTFTNCKIGSTNVHTVNALSRPKSKTLDTQLSDVPDTLENFGNLLREISVPLDIINESDSLIKCVDKSLVKIRNSIAQFKSTPKLHKILSQAEIIFDTFVDDWDSPTSKHFRSLIDALTAEDIGKAQKIFAGSTHPLKFKLLESLDLSQVMPFLGAYLPVPVKQRLSCRLEHHGRRAANSILFVDMFRYDFAFEDLLFALLRLNRASMVKEILSAIGVNDCYVAHSGSNTVDLYDCYHPIKRKDLILKELYSDYCGHFYNKNYSACTLILEESKRDRRLTRKDRTRKMREARDEKYYCQMMSSAAKFVASPLTACNAAGELLSEVKDQKIVPKLGKVVDDVSKITAQIESDDIVARIGDTVDNVNDLSSKTRYTLNKVDHVMDDFSRINLVSRASQLTSSIELLCKKTSSSVDKANSIFDQVTQFLAPSSSTARKAVIVAAASKLFASCEFSVSNLFAYFACVCATFDFSASFFTSTYASFKAYYVTRADSYVGQSSTAVEESVESLSLYASVTQTIGAFLGVSLTTSEISKKLGEFGRAATGGEKIHKMFTSIFNWVRDKYFSYKYGITFAQYQMQVKFPQLTSLAESVFLINKATNDEIDSTKALCEIIIETHKLANEMAASTLKESDASTYIRTLKTSMDEAYKRAKQSPVMNKPSRKKPFAIYLYGKPGTGKTNLTDIIIAKIYNRYYAGKYTQGYLHSSFSRKTENEYWEGYNGQPIVVYDDVFQLQDSREKPNPEMMELIRVINDDDYQLHMAALDSKVGTYFQSDFVVCTANTRIPECKSISAPQAVYRRFDVCVDVEVNERFGKKMNGKNGTYYGVDDTKVSSQLDTRVYDLSTYDMNAPNGGASVLHPGGVTEDSLEAFMTYLFRKIDSHRSKNSDRSGALQQMAGEKAISQTNNGSLLAKEIGEAHKLKPSTEAIRSMSGNAPFTPTTSQLKAPVKASAPAVAPLPNNVSTLPVVAAAPLLQSQDSSVVSTTSLDAVPVVQSTLTPIIPSVSFNKKDEKLLVTPGEPEIGWRDRLTSVRKRVEEILSSIWNSSVTQSTKVTVWDVPVAFVSDRYQKVKAELLKFSAWLQTKPSLKEMFDATFENLSTVILGVISVVGIVMAGKYAVKKLINVSCPLQYIKTIEELTKDTDCACDNCKLINPFVARADEYDDTRRLSSHLFKVLKESSKDEVLVKHLEKLMEAEKVLSDMREHDMTRTVKILKKTQAVSAREASVFDKFHTVDARQTLKAELSSGDSTTKGSSKTMVSEIASGSAVTKGKSSTMVSEGMGDRIRKFISGAPKNTILADDDMMVAQSGKDQCYTEQYNKCVARNSVRLSCSRVEGDILHSEDLNGVFIGGRILLMPHHMYLRILKSDRQEFKVQNFLRNESSTFSIKECVVKQMTSKNGTPLDCAMVSMPNRVPSYPELKNLFAQANELQKVMEGDAMLVGFRQYGDGHKVNLRLINHVIPRVHIAFQRNHCIMGEEETSYVTAAAAMYEVDSRPGDCGSLLFSRDSNMRGRIISFHVAGGRSGGMGIILSKEMVTRNLDDFKKMVPDERKFVKGSFQCQFSSSTTYVNPLVSGAALNVPGDYLSVGLSKQHATPSVTNLNPSAIHNMVFKTVTKPAHLRPVMLNGSVVNPLMKGIAKAFTVQPMLNNEVLEIAANDVFQQFKHTQKDLVRLMTYEESIKGVEGYEFASSLNRVTSAGFPWFFDKNASNGKRHWLGTGDEWDCSNVELRTAVDDILRKAKDNQRSDIVFVSTLKDERRPFAKVDQGKTRVFEAGPMHYTIAVRQYYLGFIESVMRNRITNEVCVGTNVYSYDWHRLATKLSSKGGHVIAGDFSNFDGSLHQEILWKINDIINQWYDDGKENARVRNVLFEEIVNSIVSVDGVLLQKTHAQPSGNPLTVIVNSIFNQIVMRMAYLLAKKEQGMNMMCDFVDHVAMATYGDDNVLNISSAVIDWYNQVTITKHLSTFGLTYTDEAKSGECVAYRTLKDVNFLKRKFRLNESGIYVAPMLIDTVRDMSNWVRGKQIRSATQENVLNSLREFALHGDDVYRKEIHPLKVAFASVGLESIRYPLYSEHESFFLEQRNQ